MKLKGYDVLLLVLAVVTAGAIWLALGSVGSTPAGMDAGGQRAASPGEGTSTRTDDPGEPAATSEPTSATPSASADDERATTSPPTDSTSDQTDTTSDEPTSAQQPSSAARAFAKTLAGQDGEPVDVVVLGDDTSNLRSEWVQLWGQEAAESRAVTVVQWAEMVDIQYAEPDVLSQTGDGGPLTIWSASRAGSDIESVTQRLGLFLEPDPDLVVISLGANNDDAGEAVQQLDALVEDLQNWIGDTQVALMRQGQGAASDDVDHALAAWAGEQGLFVIDARSADSARRWAELVVEQTSAQE